MQIIRVLAFFLGASFTAASPVGPDPEDSDAVTKILKSLLPALLGNIEQIASQGPMEFDDILGNIGLISLPGREASEKVKRDPVEQMRHIKSAVGTLCNGAIEFAKQAKFNDVVDKLEQLKPVLEN